VYDKINVIYTAPLGFPLWVWIGTAIVAATFGLLLLTIAYDMIRPKPVKTLYHGDLAIELWVKQRRMPAAGEAMIVPVAPDLKMVNGIAKWVRDATADDIQRQALTVAPLAPGEVFVGRGGKFRFGHTALVVVMDDKKVPSTRWITDGVARAITESRAAGANNIILPDFTEDLLRQPQTITEQQRRDSCGPIARAMLAGVIQAGDTMETVRIWVWRKGNEDIYAEEMARLEDAPSHSGHAHAPA
jgi:hypothetical protein